MKDFLHSEFIQIWAHHCTAEVARRLRAFRGGFHRFFEDCAPLAESKPAELIYLLQFRERHAAAVDRNRAQLELQHEKLGQN